MIALECGQVMPALLSLNFVYLEVLLNIFGPIGANIILYDLYPFLIVHLI